MALRPDKGLPSVAWLEWRYLALRPFKGGAVLRTLRAEIVGRLTPCPCEPVCACT